MPRTKTLKKLEEVNRLIASGTSAVQACEIAGLTTTTYYRYKKNGMPTPPAHQVKRSVEMDGAVVLRQENRALKDLVAEQALQIQSLRQYIAQNV